MIDDFRALEIVKNVKPSVVQSGNQDKGQAREIAETVRAFHANGTAPIPFPELVAGMRTIFAARQYVFSAQPVMLNE